MFKLVEQLAKILAILAIVYAALQIFQSVFGGITIELFTNTIKNEVYVKIATGIDNVINLKSSFESFKKETKLNNFKKEVFDALVKERKKSGKKLKKIDIKLVFAKLGKDKVMASLK